MQTPMNTHGEQFMLTEGQTSVVFDARRPRVISYHHGGHESVLSGGLLGAGPIAHICNLSTRAYSKTDQPPWTTSSSVEYSGALARYRVRVSDGSKPAAAFDIVFTVKEGELEAGFENVEEFEGWELVGITLPCLVSVRQEWPGASLAVPSLAGRLVSVKDCPPCEVPLRRDWLCPAPLAMVYHDDLVGVLAAPSLEDSLSSTIEECGGMKFAGVSVEFTHRIKATPPAPQFVAQQSSKCRVLLVRDETGDGRCDWQDGAVRWRSEIHAKLNPLYKDTWIYKIMLYCPGSKKKTSFDEALEIIRRIHRITGGARQIAYLVGWQHKGHDTGYPDVFTANEDLGGMPALKNLIAEAKKLNCTVSFHDNYDDAYEHSPAWDPEIIARDDKGGLMKGYVWAGGQSYIIGSARYSRRGAPERIKRTLEMYPITDTYHLDVLTAETIRYDFHPDSPADAVESMAGKWRILDEFAKHGVDVTSEGVSAPFIGRISHFYSLVRNRSEVYPVEQRIPLIPFLYHGMITYGGGGPGDPPVIDALLYGATAARDYDKETPDSVLADTYYLVVLPASLVVEMPMTAYEVDCDTQVVRYGDDTFFEASEPEQRYRMVVNGRLVAQNFSTFIPRNQTTALAYSRDEEVIRYPAPDGWVDATCIRAYDFLEERPADLDVTIESGEIAIRPKPRHPYRLEYAPQ